MSKEDIYEGNAPAPLIIDNVLIFATATVRDLTDLSTLTAVADRAASWCETNIKSPWQITGQVVTPQIDQVVLCYRLRCASADDVLRFKHAFGSDGLYP